MSLTLFKTTFKKNYVLSLIFLGVMLMYSVIIISMFSPESIDALNKMLELFPPDVMKAFGFSDVFTDLAGYLASWLYGMILTAFPMVYSIILGNRLIAKPVDSGSMACLLSLPYSRVKIAVTKGAYAFLSVAVMQAVIFSVNVLISKAMFPEQALDFNLFFRLNLTVAHVNLTVMAVVFFFSCVFCDSKLSIGLGSGVPIAFLLFNMLGNASEKAEILKKISVYGWYDAVGITRGESALAVNLVYLGIITALFAAAVLVFRKKRLAI